MNWIRIGSGNGLSPVWRQAITWISSDILSIRPLGTNFSEIRIELFVQGNAFENFVCEMTAILSRGRWVKDQDYLTPQWATYLKLITWYVCTLSVPKRYSMTITIIAIETTVKCIVFNNDQYARRYTVSQICWKFDSQWHNGLDVVIRFIQVSQWEIRLSSSNWSRKMVVNYQSPWRHSMQSLC